MITFDSLITDTLKLVDTTINSYVQQAYSNLGGYVNGLITLIATAYVMWFGYQVLYQKIKLDVMTIARYLTLLIIIMMLTTNWQYFNMFVYNIFTNEPVKISEYLSGGGSSATNALNQIWKNGSDAGSKLFEMGSWKNIEFLIYGCVVYAATFINCLVALGLFVYAKMALAAILSIGQLFILMMLWQSTRELTTGWVRGLVNFALIPIITTAVLLMTNKIANETLPGLQSAADAGNPKPYAIIAYLALAIMNGFLLKQVLSIAAMLSNSLSLEGLGNAVSLAGSALRTAAMPVTGGYKAYKGGQRLKRRYQAWQRKRQRRRANAKEQ